MQVLFNGFVNALALALLALGFQAVYLPTRVFFITLAGVYSLAPYIVWTCMRIGWPGWMASLVSVVFCAALCSLIEVANHGPLERRRASHHAHLIAALGAYLIFVQGIAMTWGNGSKVITVGGEAATRIAGVQITQANWVALLVAPAMLGCVAVIFLRSEVGIRLRGLADNRALFALSGHNEHVYRIVAFAGAGLLAGMSSLLTAYDVGFNPYVGLPMLLLAVVAVIVGGRGSFLGPVIGALWLGCMREGVAWWFSARWQEAFTFGLLAVCLLLRPNGILGKQARLEAEAP